MQTVTYQELIQEFRFDTALKVWIQGTRQFIAYIARDTPEAVLLKEVRAG